MTNLLTRIRQFLHSDDGQDLLEYGLLTVLIAVFAVGAVTTVGTTVNTTLWQVIGAASF
jgi:Flp pilus assembly pilin Flp